MKYPMPFHTAGERQKYRKSTVTADCGFTAIVLYSRTAGESWDYCGSYSVELKQWAYCCAPTVQEVDKTPTAGQIQ